MINDKILEELESISGEFLVKLRMLDGFDDSLFQSLCSTISRCGLEWKEQDSIPKLAASIFMDGYAAMVSSADQYPEKEKGRILMEADKMADLMRECLE